MERETERVRKGVEGRGTEGERRWYMLEMASELHREKDERVRGLKKMRKKREVKGNALRITLNILILGRWRVHCARFTTLLRVVFKFQEKIFCAKILDNCMMKTTLSSHKVALLNEYLVYPHKIKTLTWRKMGYSLRNYV